jgi:hypothetical protein
LSLGKNQQGGVLNHHPETIFITTGPDPDSCTARRSWRRLGTLTLRWWFSVIHFHIAMSE